MRKLKHKKLGLVVEKHLNYHYKIVSEGDNKGELIKSFLVDKSDDWEEVKEDVFMFHNNKSSNLGYIEEIKEGPNYLITAFRETHNLFGGRKISSIGQDGLYGGWHTLEEMLKNPPCVESGSFEIYSVKNSKGEEWTLSDKFDTNISKNCIITKFEIIGNIIGVYAEGKHGFMELDWIFKCKKPLYTTTDGVEIFEGDNHNGLYLLNKDLTLLNDPSARVVYNFSLSDVEVCNRFLTFTSEENRDKYIKENSKKPVFISADGKEIFEGDAYYLAFDNILVETHKADISYIFGKEACLIRFSTKQLAQEYIDQNKPKYSLNDIEKCYPSPTGFENRIKDIPLVATLFSNLKRLGK